MNTATKSNVKYNGRMYLGDVVQARVQLRVFEHDNESLFSVEAGKFVDRLSDCRLLKKKSVKWGCWLFTQFFIFYIKFTFWQKSVVPLY
jgi:hypothetical protein